LRLFNVLLHANFHSSNHFSLGWLSRGNVLHWLLLKFREPGRKNSDNGINNGIIPFYCSLWSNGVLLLFDFRLGSPEKQENCPQQGNGKESKAKLEIHLASLANCTNDNCGYFGVSFMLVSSRYHLLVRCVWN